MDVKLIRFILEQAEHLAVSRRIEIYQSLLRSLDDREQKQQILDLVQELQRVEERSNQILFSFPR